MLIRALVRGLAYTPRSVCQLQKILHPKKSSLKASPGKLRKSAQVLLFLGAGTGTAYYVAQETFFAPKPHVEHTVPRTHKEYKVATEVWKKVTADPQIHSALLSMPDEVVDFYAHASRNQKAKALKSLEDKTLGVNHREVFTGETKVPFINAYRIFLSEINKNKDEFSAEEMESLNKVTKAFEKQTKEKHRKAIVVLLEEDVPWLWEHQTQGPP